MIDVVRFSQHRPALESSLLSGEQKVIDLMQGASREYRADHTLIRGGTNHEYVYRLKKGWACRTRRLTDGREQLLLLFLPGDLFAVKSMYVTCHFDDVKLLTDAVVESVHYKELFRAISVDADVAVRCMWQVVEEERRLHSWVFGLGQGTAEERMALLLIDLRGRLAFADVIPKGALVYPMPLTQKQLADHLGITSVHVNRILKAYRDDRVVTVREGQVVITDLDELTRRAFPLLDAFERKTPEYVADAGSQAHG